MLFLRSSKPANPSAVGDADAAADTFERSALTPRGWSTVGDPPRATGVAGEADEAAATAATDELDRTCLARPDTAGSARWFRVAVGALGVAGLFSVVPLIGRVPLINEIITDPSFARRWLVVHVNLALVVWFYAFLAALFTLIPARGGRLSRWLIGLWPLGAVGGIAAFVFSAALPGADPIIANYIPVLDHPLFLCGLGVLGLGIGGAVLSRRLLPWPLGRRSRAAQAISGANVLPAESVTALRAAAVALWLGLVTVVVALIVTDRSMFGNTLNATVAYYDIVMWGGGHVLQFASVLTMLGVWMLLLQRLLGRSAIPTWAARALIAVLAAPLLVAPFVTADGTDLVGYRSLFTDLMRFAIFPVVSLFILWFLVVLVRAGRRGDLAGGRWRSHLFSGFATSAVMTVLGFVLGALISSSTTMIPAHYHTSIGAVTVSLMACAYVLMEAYGYPLTSKRLRRLAAWQPLVFGIGQTIFAFGLAIAGTTGMRRKVYGREQIVRSADAELGLIVMCVGGVFAVAGGIMFLSILYACVRRRRRERAQVLTAGTA